MSWLKLLYDWQSVSLGVGHPFGAHDQILLFPFFCRKIALLFVLGRPLSWEDGSVICSAICQSSESRRTHNHTLLSHLRLLGSLSVASYDSQGLRWEYSYPPPSSFPIRSRTYYLRRGPTELLHPYHNILLNVLLQIAKLKKKHGNMSWCLVHSALEREREREGGREGERERGERESLGGGSERHYRFGGECNRNIIWQFGRLPGSAR
jgi:hypothetical protein